MTNEKSRFLVVDDDAVCVMAIKRALKKLGIANQLQVATDGVQALKLLRGTALAPAHCLPYIVILDINMPKMSGHEFLKEIRSDEGLRKTVVFMMSSSDAQSDIDKAYDAHVAGYIIKTGGPDGFWSAWNMLVNYANTVALPKIANT